MWARAFETLGLKKDLLKSLRREEIEQKYEPFKSASVKKIGCGNFNQVKIPKLVVEIQFIENVG